MWFLQEKSTTPTPPVQEGSFLRPNAQRRREKELRITSQIWATSEKMTRSGAVQLTISDLRVSYGNRKEAGCVFCQTRCSSGQRVCVWLDFFGSFCVKTKRTQEWAIKEKHSLIKGGNVGYGKTLWLSARKVRTASSRQGPSLSLRMTEKKTLWFSALKVRTASSRQGPSELRSQSSRSRAQLCPRWQRKNGIVFG